MFIEAGLKPLLSQKDSIFVLEIGFGTGLNAILTLKVLYNASVEIDYTALEFYPLQPEIVDKISFFDKKTTLYSSFLEMHRAEWGKVVRISDHFLLTKLNTNFTDLSFNEENKTFDVIYFDAFAPDKQPEMWTQQIFDYLFSITTFGGALVTYCAKGVVRRMIQQSGYTVERLPGPPGKREMLRATKNKLE